jgi:hypothetical protein
MSGEIRGGGGTGGQPGMPGRGGDEIMNY